MRIIKDVKFKYSKKHESNYSFLKSFIVFTILTLLLSIVSVIMKHHINYYIQNPFVSILFLLLTNIGLLIIFAKVISGTDVNDVLVATGYIITFVASINYNEFLLNLSLVYLFFISLLYLLKTEENIILLIKNKQNEEVELLSHFNKKLGIE